MQIRFGSSVLKTSLALRTQFEMATESLPQALNLSSDSGKSTLERLERIRRSQAEYGVLFSKLTTIINQLRDKYAPADTQSTDDQRESEDHYAEDADSSVEHSSGASSSSEILPSSQGSSHSSYVSPSTGKRGKAKSLKRKLSLEDSSDYIEIDAVDEYPKLVEEYSDGMYTKQYIIGPNGTRLMDYEFNEICWGTAAGATRNLLSTIFTNDTLATHSLTGKPSPAFYGRERPQKMQLDPLKTADIIHCVLAKCDNSNEREVRATITTKCADTAKRFKRRLEK